MTKGKVILCSITILLAVGCNQGNDELFDKVLTEDEEPELFESENNYIEFPNELEGGEKENSEATPRTQGGINIGWSDYDQNDVIKVKDLVFTISNNTNQWVSVVPTLSCSGMLTKSGVIKFDEIVLEVGESVELSVRAEELPIRSTTNVNTVSVSAVVLHEGAAEEYGIEVRETRKYSPAVYYLHNEDYGKVYVFGEKYLLDELDGHIAGLTDENDPGDNSLGYVADENGIFAPVYMDDESFNISDGVKLLGESLGTNEEELSLEADNVFGLANEGTTQRPDEPIDEIPVNICARYKILYEDSGYGEDIFNETTITAHPASYAEFDLLMDLNGMGEWVYVEGGMAANFEADGCQTLTLRRGYYHKVIVRSKFERSNGRKVWVLKSSATSWSTSNVNSNTKNFYLAPDAGVYSTIYADFGNRGDSPDWVYNASGVAARTARYANTIGMTSNQNIVIRMTDNTQYSGNVGDYYRVEASENSGNWKFKLAHEIGHAIGYADIYHIGGGLYGGDFSIDLCNCEDVLTDLDHNHCLQKKMDIRAAQKEGWSHFVSSTLFNNRGGSDGYFAYYKEVKTPGINQILIYQPPYPVILRTSSGDRNQKQMFNYCSDDYDRHYGIEWDWLHFFWNTWHYGSSDRLSVSEMRNVWPKDSESSVDENFYWGPLSNYYTIIERAEDELSAAKYERFGDMGEAAKVNLGY